MSGIPTGLRVSLRLRFAVLAAVALLLIGTSAIVAAHSAAPGPFTGCLAAKNVPSSPVLKGMVYNVAQSATTPLAPCSSGDTMVTFSNAQGPTGAAGPAGPKGATGATGPTGASGPAGPAGPKGAPGPTGPAGVAGPRGDTGSAGPAGPAGSKGDTGAIGPAGAAGAPGGPGAPGQDGTSLTAELLPALDSRCGAAGGFEIFGKPPNPNAPVSLGVLCNGAAGAQGPKGDPGTAGSTGPQGAAGGAFADLSDLNGTGCTRGSNPGTVQASVDASTGHVSILCILSTTGGGGGGTKTNTAVIGDCQWDDGSPDDADVPSADFGFTAGCQNGTPTLTPKTNNNGIDCQWDDGSPYPADKPDAFIENGFLTTYTCINDTLGTVVTPVP